jgi:DNA topoisomerase-1
LQRIRKLAVPPAWTDVWICPDPLGHLQATGRDSRGRKVYRYHPRWREVRDATKYDRLAAFGAALPALRTRVEADLSLPGLPRDKLVAAVVRLLENTLIRVGNEEYARTNGSYGLTTLRNRHVRVERNQVLFSFRAKSGIRRRIALTNRKLAAILRRCQELPGQALFTYLDADGEPQTLHSTEVSSYLRAVMGGDFTAKDFRTWAATTTAALALLGQGDYESDVQGRHKIGQAMEIVAEALGNTPAVARHSYVHPAVIDAYLDRSLFVAYEHPAHLSGAFAALQPEEQLVLRLLAPPGPAERKAG